MNTYLRMAISLIIISSGFFNAVATVVYTDVNPDQTFSVSGSVYHLDVNNDAAIDFDITHSYSTTVYKSGTMYPCYTYHYYYSNSITVKNSNSVAVNSGYASSLPALAVIDASLTWSDTTYNPVVNTLANSTTNSTSGFCPRTTSTTTSGNWYGKSDQYLGLRIKAGGMLYYGWARLSFFGAGSFTIKDYAFNDVPNQQILAGESSCLISNLPNSICVGSNFNVSYTLIGTFGLTNSVTAELSDATGSFANPVGIGSVVSNVSGIINASIPVGTLAGAAYRIRVTTSNPARISSPNLSNIILNNGAAAAAITSLITTANCGEYISLSAAAAAGNTYQWRMNGINILNAISLNYNASSSGDYSCQVTNACGAGTSNVIALSFTQVPAVITSATTTSCGGSVSLSAAKATGNSYQWQLNGNNITGAISSSYSAAASGNYTCMVTNGCGSGTSNIITVTINPLPAVNLLTASPAATACTGPVILSATTVAGSTYVWYFNSVLIPGATGSFYPGNATGSYFMKETNAFGCARSTTSIYLLIGPPVATISPLSASVCHGNNVTLYAYPSGSLYSYQWKKNGADILGATAQSYSTTRAGIYSANVTLIAGGCSNLTPDATVSRGCRLAGVNSSTEETVETDELIIAPNPVSSFASVSFDLPETQKISIQVFDFAGRIVNTLADGLFEEGKNKVEWNMSDVNAGMYFIKLEYANYSETKKMSVIK